uniref:Uncharacterized protein n=1 Tax=Rhizophora mucronata TaxID=61149 RepID=A0A2P2PEU1_RHIMU
MLSLLVGRNLGKSPLVICHLLPPPRNGARRL